MVPILIYTPLYSKNNHNLKLQLYYAGLKSPTFLAHCLCPYKLIYESADQTMWPTYILFLKNVLALFLDPYSRLMK